MAIKGIEINMKGFEIDKGYIVHYGLLKLFEVVCLVIAWATLLHAVPAKDRGFKLNFCIAMCIMGFLFAIIWFICNLCKLFHKWNMKKKHIVFGIIHIVVGGVIFIAAVLVGHTIIALSISSVTGKVGEAFTILSVLAFVADGIMHIVLGRIATGQHVDDGSASFLVSTKW